ncbi:hypothetical protein OIU76_002064 [Salix suchowensis]|uniref:Uncharacterized protein n=2 Tax=Salix TaxID=40685 RepID=A0A9Q0P5C3_9ROSI|nr:hypothetical protein OIU78_020313 [Salix suchowensis]KAJ6352966.1 hypothetical protein OIU76_002064 [Salix suchowensis]KAJ6398695.1 hypothetical protein OIU77_019466 [Salix suchowensis]KAJ6681879.1 hypothetical protein OIU74_020193 [Salix koriyanagi]
MIILSHFMSIYHLLSRLNKMNNYRIKIHYQITTL